MITGTVYKVRATLGEDSWWVCAGCDGCAFPAPCRRNVLVWFYAPGAWACYAHRGRVTCPHIEAVRQWRQRGSTP